MEKEASEINEQITKVESALWGLVDIGSNVSDEDLAAWNYNAGKLSGLIIAREIID